MQGGKGMIFCPLYSGSSGNSIFIASEDTRILIDAGLPGKSIENALKEIGEEPQNIDGILITHEHSDHVKGVGVLSRKYNIPIYANEKTWQGMAGGIGNVKDHNIRIIDRKSLNIKNMDIITYDIPHDAAAPLGYAVCAEGKKACVATDLGNFTEEVRKNIWDADIVLLESNHDVEMLKFGPYPYVLKRRVLSDIGHLSNEACGNAIVEIMTEKPKRVVLGHLSKTNNYPDLAYQTVLNILNDNKIKLGEDIFLSIADRNKPSSYINL
jgi:phosphoribosyl 1,2-cyclic phosphodiesterase